MPTATVELDEKQSNGTMSKAKEKSVKKRAAEEEEEEVCRCFKTRNGK